MNRSAKLAFLCVLVLPIVMVGGCGTSRSDKGPGSLPWFYLGDAYLALAFSPEHSRSTGCNALHAERSDDLFNDLKDLNKKELVKLLTEEGRSDGEPPGVLGLLKKRINRKRGDNGEYSWRGWPEGIGVRIRRFPSDIQQREFILGPQGLVIQWPFQGFRPTHRVTLDDILDGKQPELLKSAEYDPSQDIYVNAVLWTGDQIIREDSAAILALEPYIGDSGQVGAFLSAYATAKGFGYATPLPNRFKVSVEESRPTTKSLIQVGRRMLHFKLGWDARVGYAEWPCGAG